MAISKADAQRRLHLRVSIKILLAVGLVFLLLPFVKSLPGVQAGKSDAAALLDSAGIAPGATQQLQLADGSALFVTRSSPALAASLRDFPQDRLWFPSAPGLHQQPWFVLGARSAVDEPLRFLPAQGPWPGGFVAESGGAWDVAGRALKPWPGHPSGHAAKIQNLPPLPFRRREGGIELPAPRAGNAPPE